MLFLEKIEQKKVYIVLVILICMLIGIIYTRCFIPPKNISSATLVCLKTEKNSEGKVNNTGSLELSKNLASTFEEIAKSQLTIKEAKKDVNINVKNSEITLQKVSNSDTFCINIKNVDSNNIIKFSNKLVDVFSKKVENMLGNVQVYVIDEPHIEKQTYGFSFVYAILTSLGIGISVMFLYIAFLIQFDKKIKNVKDIESDICIRNLGVIPENTTTNEVLITFNEEEKNQTSKAFRKLRSNIQFVNVNNKEKNTILITSPVKCDGKSYIASNLAVSFATVGKKVILIDCDMENGKQSRIFNIPNNLGLSNYLSGLDEKGLEINELINKFINETEIKNLNIVTSGTVPPNSSELLTSPKLEELIKDLSVFYDVVIIDGVPVLAKTDSLILTRVVNSTILVSNYKKTNKDDLWQAKKDIQNVGGRIIGNVLNKSKEKEKKHKFKKIQKINTNEETIFSKCIKVLKNKILEIKNFIVDLKNKSEQKLLLEAKQTEVIEINNNSTINYITPIEETKSTIAESNLEEQPEEKLEPLKISKKTEKETQDVENTLPEVEVKTIYKNEENNINPENVSEKVETKLLEKIKLNSKNILKNSKSCILGFGKKLKENIETTINETEINKDKLEEQGIQYVAEEMEEKVIESENQELLQENETLFNNEKIKNETIKEKKEAYTEKEIANNTEKIENPKEIESVVLEKEFKKEDLIDDFKENDDAILVIVDAYNAVCRVFNKYCFTEKQVRGIDPVDGLEKAHYSAYLLKKKIEGLMNIYNLSKEQAKRVDTLIYETLETYDDIVWLERKITSNKAESYIKCITQEYEQMPEEDKKEYETRCQFLRKQELRKELIEIEYNLDNLWNVKRMNFTDKIVMNRFAGLYDEETKVPFLRSKELKVENSLENNNPKIKDGVRFNKIKNAFSYQINKIKENLSNLKIEQVKVKSVEEIQKEVMNSESTDYNNISIDEYKEEKKNFEELENKKAEEERKRELEFFKEKKREERMIQKRISQDEKRAKKMEKIKKREETRKSKELEKQKQKQEARIEEELLVDNLYPKTKNNKDI